MIANISHYKLKPGLATAALDQMMRDTRSQLLKINGILNVRSGKSIDREGEYQFGLYLEFENLDKMSICMDDPIFVKFVQEVIRPNAVEELSLVYELEPGRDIKYS